MDKFQSNVALEVALKNMAHDGLIEPRTENNQYLAISYKGSGTLITPKWNIKIYTTGSGVCTDVLNRIIMSFYCFLLAITGILLIEEPLCLNLI